jgi:galactose oxidase
MTEQLVTATRHDMFCPGTTVLPNGVVMISGGATSNATSFYDYRNNQWSIGPEMILSRGYQAHTLLANGEVLSYGGSWRGVNRNKNGEVWSPQSNAWRLLPGVPSRPAVTGDIRGRYRSDNHYWIFLAPNGKVRLQQMFLHPSNMLLLCNRFSTPVQAKKCTGLQHPARGRLWRQSNVATMTMP